MLDIAGVKSAANFEYAKAKADAIAVRDSRVELQQEADESRREWAKAFGTKVSIGIVCACLCVHVRVCLRLRPRVCVSVSSRRGGFFSSCFFFFCGEHTLSRILPLVFAPLSFVP